MSTAFNRPFSRALILLCAALLTLTAHAPTALAAPEVDDEGAVPSVREVLDTALQQYNDAKGRLDVSLQRQAELNEQIRLTGLQLELLYAEVAVLAAAAYRGSRINTTNVLLETDSPEALLNAMTTLTYLTSRDDRKLRTLKAAKQTHAEQQQALADEIAFQKDQLALMEKQKKAAENALKRVGGGQVSAGFVPGKATATQAPRNADGSWPKQTCSVDDPTTSGCITPRTLHAYQEARRAGYTRYTSCYRSGSSGEHPKGRACDFSSAKTTFLNSRATGDDKTYGDKLTGWLMANSDRLGILYIIWYKQIWFPDRGWRSYGGDGTPAGDHYNHIHLSMQ
ncbi:MAG: hypothetical protein HKP61_14965 [Dactylosporangium sp.]|nr:hypothetical protein [Dactylosporangium sp.]NNJ62211.1 hypothetical protein [Dactylosporangium sp.]